MRFFAGIDAETVVWMNHTDRVSDVPDGFKVTASTDNCPVAAMADDAALDCIQFHPEVKHTRQGALMLKNFAYRICGCKGGWTPEELTKTMIEEIRQKAGEKWQDSQRAFRRSRFVCGVCAGPCGCRRQA